MPMGEKWLYEARTIHYIVVLLIAIFPGREEGGALEGGGTFSDSANYYI